MKYLALIGDFINSKEMTNRSAVQKNLKKTLANLNQKYSDFLVSRLTITLGDEFQGLFHLDAPIFKLIDDLSLALKPYTIRFGLGLGDIVTPIDPKQSIGADGPAYWSARQAIETVHAKNDYGNTKLFLVLPEPSLTIQANALLSASEHIKSNWRASQTEVFEAMLELGIYQEQFEQKKAADYLGLKESAFTKRLKSSGVKIYFRCRLAVQDLIRQYEEESR
ncbi:SatD family protein [Streptococcus merionis]|uniref:DNA-binding protein n=1 Tax=Streptococcus merionis TaxID=400065 RepID=A0A239SPT5_9STRE|nr:SatD family protein [Streptococcus merionis]SNU87417.1 DNA-binding protein [Streptococcus merionis]